jgi:hypothetical protein
VVTDGEVDSALRSIDDLDDQQSRETAKQFVRNTEVDGQALKLIDEVDDQTLRRLTDLDDGAQFRKALARQNTRDVVDAQQIRQTVKTVEELDGPEQRRAMRLVERTPSGGGLKLVRGLDTSKLKRLLSDGCSVSRSPASTTTASSKTASTLSGGCLEQLETFVKEANTDIEDVTPRLNRLDDEMIDAVVTRIGRNPDVADSLVELDKGKLDTLVKKTEGGEMADALDLYSADIPYSEIVSAVDNPDADIASINRGLQIYDNNGININPKSGFNNKKGTIGESVALPEMRSRYPERGYEIKNGVELKDQQGGPYGEFDFVVTDPDGEVVEVTEVKSVDGQASKAETQLGDNLDGIRNGLVGDVGNGIDAEQFTSNLENINKKTIGPEKDTGYNIRLDISDEGFTELTEMIGKRSS